VTEVPPSRWKVVERGRRLEVIDTRAEGAKSSTRGAPSVETGAQPGLPRRLRFDGTLGWTTHPFYDGSGPRGVVLDGGLARWIGGVVGLVVTALVVALVVFGLGILPLFGAGAAIVASNAKRLRTWLTRRLDAIAT